MTPRRRAAIAAASTSLLALALAGCSTAEQAPAEDTSGDDDSTTSTESTDGGSSAGSGDYADGEYTADGTYQSPGGTETITVTLTLADGVIDAVEVDNPETTNPNSLRYQGEFIDGISAEVVGVPLDEVSVDRVGGSSLTSGGFEDALETIRGEASA